MYERWSGCFGGGGIDRDVVKVTSILHAWESMAIRCTTKILTILLLQYKRIIVTIRVVVVVVVHGGGILLIILGGDAATASTANRV
jgi:hypothetical protein